MITENKLIYILNFLNDFEFNENDECPYEDYPNMSNTRVIFRDEPYSDRIRLVEYKTNIKSNKKERSIFLNSLYKNLAIFLIRTIDKIIIEIQIGYNIDVLELNNLEYYHDELSFVLENGRKKLNKDYIDALYYFIKDYDEKIRSIN